MKHLERKEVLNLVYTQQADRMADAYARLKAEVEELTRLLKASTYYNTSDEVTRLKAEVERLTAFTTRTIIPNEELQAQNAMLKEEISEAAGHYNKIINDLEAQVERLTKAGDSLVYSLQWCDWGSHIQTMDGVNRWNAAKDGESMWGVVAPYVVPPCIDKYTAKEGKQ